MNAFLISSRILLIGVALSSLAITGCGTRPGATAQGAPSGTPLQTQTVEQRSQNRARVLQAIKSLTPKQRAAYFKEHPEDIKALAQ